MKDKKNRFKDGNDDKNYINYWFLTKRGWEPMYDPDENIYGWRRKDASPLNIVDVSTVIEIEAKKDSERLKGLKAEVIKISDFQKRR